MDKMQAYFSYIKSTFQPMLKPEAERVLSEYYNLQRRSDGKNAGMFDWKWSEELYLLINFAARTTIRLLESMIRIAQGMFSLREGRVYWLCIS